MQYLEIIDFIVIIKVRIPVKHTLPSRIRTLQNFNIRNRCMYISYSELDVTSAWMQ